MVFLKPDFYRILYFGFGLFLHKKQKTIQFL